MLPDGVWHDSVAGRRASLFGVGAVRGKRSSLRCLPSPPFLAPRVASPPYDVVSTAEARALVEGNPDSFLHVSRPEIDLPVGVDEHTEPVYQKGADNLKSLIASENLIKESEPLLYLYAQENGHP